MTCNIQSECTISEKSGYTTLQFVYEIGSRPWNLIEIFTTSWGKKWGLFITFAYFATI